jgi:hypothetical protein
MKKTISRVRFCLNCYQAGRPYDGMKFLVYGSDSKRGHYHYYLAPTHDEVKTGKRQIPLLGFVPHIFTVEKVLENGNFFVLYSCGCDGCDLIFKQVDDVRWMPEIKKAHTMEMTPLQWHHLEKFVDTGYEI